MSARSWLFVPGDSPAKMRKALGAGADILILDLEDSVAADRKPAARAETAAFLTEFGASGAALWVRINPLSTGLAQADLAAVIAAGPAGIVLPKPDSGAEVKAVAALLADGEARVGLQREISILPIATETPLSVFNLHSYAGVTARLAGITWGAEDLSAAVGAATPRAGGCFTPLYELARSLCLAGAAAAGVPAIETVYPDFRDLDGLRRYAECGRRDGFTGMMAIHPGQVATINAAFTPAPVEVERALKIIALFEANPGAGTLALDGIMLDAPHLRQARRIAAMHAHGASE